MTIKSNHQYADIICLFCTLSFISLQEETLLFNLCKVPAVRSGQPSCHGPRNALIQTAGEHALPTYQANTGEICPCLAVKLIGCRSHVRQHLDGVISDLARLHRVLDGLLYFLPISFIGQQVRMEWIRAGSQILESHLGEGREEQV